MTYRSFRICGTPLKAFRVSRYVPIKYRDSKADTRERVITVKVYTLD
jgi:hypothetical protein